MAVNVALCMEVMGKKIRWNGIKMFEFSVQA